MKRTRRRATRISRGWLLLLMASVAVIVTMETTLLALGTGFITSGFNSAHIDGWTLIFVFLPASAILDLGIVLGIWALITPLAARLAASSIQTCCAVGLIGVAVPGCIAAAMFGVYSILGDMFSLALAQQFSGVGASAVVEQASLQIPASVIVFAAVSVVTIVLVHLSGYIEISSYELREQLRPPRNGTLWMGALVSALAGILVLVAANAAASDLRYGFGRKLSGMALKSLARVLTDFDRDGYGLLDQPSDPAPFDASIHPYALDVPGNGVDENGVGGDHRLAPSREVEVPSPVDAGQRPHLLVVYLESFRADLIGQRLEGREITPFLNQLAAEGAASERAWVHAPWTLESRAQFFGGRLINRPGETTLIDDFKDRGYYVAHFSGQDESYGNSEALLGTERADVFYHARNDLERRTSRSTAPVSLQVSWKTLDERLGDFLDGYDSRQPLFLYANIVDTHFPYTHREIEDILGVSMLAREEIRSSRATQVFETYARDFSAIPLSLRPKP